MILWKTYLLFLTSLAALIVENSQSLAEIYFMFLKKHPKLNLKSFQSQIWTSIKKSGK